LNNKFKNFLKYFTFLFLLTSVILYGYNNIELYVNKISISSNGNNVNTDILKTQIKKKIKLQNFFNINPLNIQKELINHPWIKKIEVYKKFPDKLIIKITERVAIAIFNDISLVDGSGNIFKKLEKKKNLLKFYADDQKEVKYIYNFYKKFIKFQNLNNIQIDISYIKINSIKEFVVRTKANNLIYFGSKNIDERLGRFIQLYGSIELENLNNVEYFDMRYTNGVSVKKRR
jgi:cell division protein FtsQ|tara:strand:+ start:838 stop:1530 length:693 start_codon:yes stop_codon:yes gene_type:complete